MPLTQTEIKNAKPAGSMYRLADGSGLFLQVAPKGGKYWRLRYFFAGKEKMLALIAQFREIRTDLERLIAYGDLSQVIDDLFPDGDDSVRDLRALALLTLEETGADDPAVFFAELSNAISQPDIPMEIEEVRIMSLHKSKGLSSPVTIISGCVDGLLPKQPDPDLTTAQQDADLEEQRRLFYVGITRVKAVPRENKPGTLILTYSRHMTMANAMGAGITPASTQNGVALLHASRFIRELGPSAPAPIRG